MGGSSIEASLTRHCGPDDILTGSDLIEEREKFGYTERNVFRALFDEKILTNTLKIYSISHTATI